jgi:putative chitinase
MSGMPELRGLTAALAAAAPRAVQSVWLPALAAALTACDATTPHRIAAFLGQCAVEAGQGFGEVSESLYYTHASRLVQVFPSHFADEDAAAPYCKSPEPLANLVYANKLGNGDDASGDGWRFRGGGLLQITGREHYSAYAAARGMAADAAADYVRTPAGAADSAAWYWQTHGLNPYADAWALSAITLRINGPAMLDNAARISASNAALKAMVG